MIFVQRRIFVAFVATLWRRRNPQSLINQGIAGVPEDALWRICGKNRFKTKNCPHIRGQQLFQKAKNP